MREKEKYNIVIDPEYGYMRVDPIPTQEDVDRFYLEDFYSANYQYFNDSSLDVQKEQSEFFKGRFEDIYQNCKRLKGTLDEKTYFDIGFGFAQALLFFKEKGLNVSGIEPSKEGVEYAKKNNLDVYNANIEDFTVVGGKRYDIVSLLNVLEHLRDPASTLKNIRTQLLKPNGLLVVEVPNEFNDFQTVANNEYNLNQWWVCPPNHINYFSSDTIEILLKKCGYKVLYKEASFPLEMFLLMGDVYVGDGNLGKVCHNKRVKFELTMKKHGKSDKLRAFYEALATLNLGRQTILYASPQ
jgi:2-polyprenyl-3-methyl-5-hydroxy-6-metoxy-1,4-benzoquinol methylase